MTAVQELESTVRKVSDEVGPSVVGVSGGRSTGSGIVVADGAVLTNAHNLAEHLTVTFSDGRQAQAEVRGIDPDGDLAVLAVDTAGAPPARLAPSSPGMGSVVFALANPGGRGLRVTFGVLSGTDEAFRGPRGRRITGSLEHTAPLPRGSSGGPVADADGAVIGINTHRLGDGFYLALPTDPSLKERVEALARGESRTRPALGVALAPAKAARHLRRAVGLPERDGLLVRGVAEDSPAAAAGVREGDLLVEAGGAALAGPDDLHAVLDGLEPGAALSLKVVRGVEELDLQVQL
ncbi:MAG TPA: S1C family serine protease [Acidimicrobiales bacterium]|jgi:serine protease Do|nr:S1C family serine protease [Acidimicrobiales bacterium]